MRERPEGIEVSSNMRVILTCLLFAVLALAKAEEKGYTTQYDNIDLDEIFSNERLYEKYFKCLINESPCTSEGKTLKEIVPDALKDGCAKCNEKQKGGMEKGFKFLIEKKKADFDKLRSIFDPTGEYWKKYKADAEKRGIKFE